MAVGAAPLGSLYQLRGPMRAQRRCALLDGTSFDDLFTALTESGLYFDSLFFGEDAEYLQGEAPYLVALDPDWPEAVRDLLQKAAYPHAGLITDSPVCFDDLRRHCKAWLTVRLPHDPEKESDLALFRFFDARILAAFLATLGPADAASFFGPAKRLIALQGSRAMVWQRPAAAALAASLPTADIGATAAEAAATPRLGRIGRPPGEFYQISADQVQAMSAVTEDVFRKRLVTYLTTVFTEEAAGMSPKDLLVLVDAAIQDCARLGSMRENDVVSMAITRLVSPDLIEDQDYWETVIEQRPNPKTRSGTFLAEVGFSYERGEARDAFYYQTPQWYRPNGRGW